MIDRSIDPFADSIVTEPRAIEPPVHSLNEPALKRLLAAFEQVARQPVPRLSPPTSAELVTSAEPGYGKSHLIGRLFQKLDDDATLVYLRPFQDPASCWVSLLSKIVTELDFPDEADKLTLEPGDVTQLDTLARRVLVSLVHRLLSRGRIHHGDPDRAIGFFERYPNSVFETPEWRAWLHENQAEIPRLLDTELRAIGIQLRPSNAAWLKVLFAYAFGEEEPQRRQIALDWLNCSPLDAQEGKLIGLRLADLPPAETTPEGRNEASFERIRDLFKLAAFYRPFLLCFDQTEVYDQRPELARSLGLVLSRLRRETVNHLAVVTGNQFVWDEKVVNYFEQADRDCLDPEPIRLAGMTKEQATALLRQRLRQFHVADDEAAEFLTGDWLDELFELRKTRSVRQVLLRASKQWGSYQEPDVRAMFDSYRRRLLADPKRLEYDAGVFQWTLEHVLGPAASMNVERFQSPRGYLTLRWTDPTREALFGFEPGQAWKRWEAIFNEGSRFHQQGHHEGRTTHVCFFRTPLQRPLPQRNAAQIAAAPGRFFRVVELDREDAATLYAAHDFHADVLQGNRDFTAHDVIAYLRERIKEYADRVLGSTRKRSTVPPPLPLRERVEGIVRNALLITVPLVLQRLAPDFEATETAVLEACAQIPSVRVFSSPQCTVVQWSPLH